MTSLQRTTKNTKMSLNINATNSDRMQTSVLHNKTLNVATATDSALKLDFVNSDYLQSLFRYKLLIDRSRTHQMYMTDQLIKHNYKYYNMHKLSLKLRDEIEEVELSNAIHKCISVIQNYINKFHCIEESYSVKYLLKLFLFNLKLCSNRIALKNAELSELNDDKLLKSSKLCCKAVELILSSIQSSQEGHHLAEQIRNVDQSINYSVIKQDQVMQNMEEVIFKLVQDLSNNLAGNDNY